MPMQGVESVSFDSQASLLDWDLILLGTTIPSVNFHSVLKKKGIPFLGNNAYSVVCDQLAHWSEEIWDGIKNGKVIFVFAGEYQEFCYENNHPFMIDRIETSNNYNMIPVELSPIVKQGKEFKLADSCQEIFYSLQNDFISYMNYKVQLRASDCTPLFLTKSGDRTVGCFFTDVTSGGALVVLPHFDFEKSEFLKNQDDDLHWTAEANAIGHRLLTELIAISKALKKQGNTMPKPKWMNKSEYLLATESVAHAQLVEVTKQIDDLHLEMKKLDGLSNKYADLRQLLYGTGKPLESGVIAALKCLGFKAGHFSNTLSEFDVVFSSTEGRLIGEVEGKDRKSVNIDKLRQLQMNLHEDFANPKVNSMAKGVLFGNGSRLLPIEDRGQCFTKKCISSTTASPIALVNTVDLFFAAKFAIDSGSSEYAASCRKAIFSAVGLVKFPDSP